MKTDLLKRRSTWLPLILAVYLAVMAVIGYGDDKNKYYWWILAGSVLIIIALAWALRKKEAYQEQRSRELDAAEYGRYNETDDSDDVADNGASNAE